MQGHQNKNIELYESLDVQYIWTNSSGLQTVVWSNCRHIKLRNVVDLNTDEVRSCNIIFRLRKDVKDVKITTGPSCGTYSQVMIIV